MGRRGIYSDKCRRPEEFDERTRARYAETRGVCWVTDRRARWLGHVPGVRVERDQDDRRLHVVDGIGRFDVEWCIDPTVACDVAYRRGLGVRRCHGHGYWTTEPLSLDDFVAHVLAGRVQPHRAMNKWRGRKGWQLPTRVIWTAQRYVATEAQQRAQQDPVLER